MNMKRVSIRIEIFIRRDLSLLNSISYVARFKECVSTRMHCALKQLRRPFFWQSNCRDTYNECNPANLLSILAAIRLFYIFL